MRGYGASWSHLHYRALEMYVVSLDVELTSYSVRHSFDTSHIAVLDRLERLHAVLKGVELDEESFFFVFGGGSPLDLDVQEVSTTS